MTSRPLHIAFIALTLSLVVSLSLWVFHASYEQNEFSRAVTLQMPSAPAEINSDEVRENLRSDSSAVELAAEIDDRPQMVEMEQPPELIGIEAAPVSQNAAKDASPAPFPSSEDPPELTFESPSPNQASADEPLDLPELSLDESQNEGPFEFLPLDPAGSESEAAQQPTPPLVELVPEPLTAPRPPAWLSVQATLEAEIEELQQKQKELEGELSDRQDATDYWEDMQKFWNERQQAWKQEKQQLTEQLTLAQTQKNEARRKIAESDRQIAESRKLLESSQQEAAALREQFEQLNALLEESHSVNAELKNTIKEKLSTISRLENEARKTKHQIDQLRGRGGAVQDTQPQFLDDENASGRSTRVPRTDPPALLPPLPDETSSVRRGPQPELSQAAPYSSEPIVPRLAGQPDPPDEFAPPARSEATQPRTPLIPAETWVTEGRCCPGCGVCLDERPKKKGLIYDLKDWYRDWRHSEHSCSACEPLCTESRLCTDTGECATGNIGLIPDLVNWWKHRHDRCDCGDCCDY